MRAPEDGLTAPLETRHVLSFGRRGRLEGTVLLGALKRVLGSQRRDAVRQLARLSLLGIREGPPLLVDEDRALVGQDQETAGRQPVEDGKDDDHGDHLDLLSLAPFSASFGLMAKARLPAGGSCRAKRTRFLLESIVEVNPRFIVENAKKARHEEKGDKALLLC